LMQRSLDLAEKADALLNNKKIGMSRYKAANVGDIFLRNSEYNRQLAMELKFARGISRGSSSEKRIVDLLTRSLSDCLKSKTFYRDQAFASRKISSALLAGDICYDLINSVGSSEAPRKKYTSKAKRYFRDASKSSKLLGLSETTATSSWRLAQVFDREGQFAESALEYRKAHDAFESIQHSGLHVRLYEESSRYMLACCDIENAKAAHVSSDFERASALYREASSIIASTRRWKSRSHLYFAESLIEEAEKLSLVESSGSTIDLFSRAVQSLSKLESDLSNDNSVEARSFTALSRHLSSFCNARIMLEKSKEDFRTDNIDRSVKSLSEAGNAFSELSQDHYNTDPLGSNELMSLASLCSALKYFLKAQTEGDPTLIQKAEKIFIEASDQSKSASLKLLLKGLSKYAAFLYFSKLVEQSLGSSLDIEKLSESSKAIDSAERILSRMGNKSFLIMLRASKHLLDASIKVSAAEREIENQETKARLYSQAQRSLLLASKYYQELGSSQRLKESLDLLSDVRQTKELIPLANKMLAEVASSQMIYSAISSTSVLDASPEDSARQIDSSYLVLDVSLEHPMIYTEGSATISLVISNLGKEKAIALSIQEALPEGFKYDRSKNEKRMLNDDRSLILNLRLEPGASETINLVTKPTSIGEFIWHPTLLYQDFQHNEKVTAAETVKVVVESGNLDSAVQSLREKKTRLERELSDNPPTAEGEVISLREELSKVEEELQRFRNEYENLVGQLDQIRQDLVALNNVQDEILRQEEKERLETEERILRERIERRRSLFQPRQSM
jgi:hypothetical protein